VIKIAFVGLERMGKSTLINGVAYELSKQYKVNLLTLPEITTMPNNLDADLDSVEVQMSLIAEQIANEKAYTDNDTREILLADRTPIDILMYLEFLIRESRIEARFLGKVKQKVFDWAKTYKTIYYVIDSDIELKTNGHFTDKDIENRNERRKLLDSYMYNIAHVKVSTSIHDTIIPGLIAKEIRETLDA